MRSLFVAGVLTCSTLMAEQQIVLMRHGESDHNAAKIYNSNPNHPTYKISNLTDNGIKTAKKTAQTLLEQGITDSQVVAVYVSPMPRTQETAKILADEGVYSSNKIIIDERLTEVDAGDLEGGPILEHWEDYMSEVYHCEPIEKINLRVDSFYKEIKNKHQDGCVVVVTHGIITQKLKNYLCESKDKIKPGAAEVYLIK